MEQKYKKEKSYMLAIPQYAQELTDINLVMSRIKNATDFTVLNMGLNLHGARGVLVKVGLMVDDEYRTDTNEREHIWFELKSVDDDTFTAVLTQEPYMVSDMHEGAIGTYPYSDITDWLVFTEEDRISPDEVYIMEITI